MLVIEVRAQIAVSAGLPSASKQRLPAGLALPVKLDSFYLAAVVKILFSKKGG